MRPSVGTAFFGWGSVCCSSFSLFWSLSSCPNSLPDCHGLQRRLPEIHGLPVLRQKQMRPLTSEATIRKLLMKITWVDLNQKVNVFSHSITKNIQEFPGKKLFIKLNDCRCYKDPEARQLGPVSIAIDWRPRKNSLEVDRGF